MKYEFDGISTEHFNEADRKEFDYEIDYSDDDYIMIKTNTFVVELDRKKVKLHTYIKHTDLSNYDDTDEQIVEIGVMPDFKSLSKNTRENILSQFDDDDKEYYKKNTNALLQDVMLEGYFITLRSETTTDKNEVEHLIDSAVAVHHSIEGLIGFELDRYQNRLGNTGWDFLSSYCEGKDLIKLAMKRFK